MQSKGRWLDEPDAAERLAVRLLEGVGGEREWWLAHGEFAAHVAHLRVAVTPEEWAVIGPGLAEHDAGATGPERPRTLSAARPG